MGLPIADLELLTLGTVFDMFTEKANDSEQYDQMADQADFDRF